jgi:hypothetical protein
MKRLNFLILALIVAGSFLTTDVKAQLPVERIVFVMPPPEVQIALEIFLETDELAIRNDLYFTGYYMNMSGYYHPGYVKTFHSAVMFQAVCRGSNGNYWFVSFDALGNLLFVMEGSNVIPD